MCNVGRVVPGLPSASAVTPRAVRVLVVDDEAMLREIIGEFLTFYGYHAVLAGTDAEAIVALAEHGVPDLMIIDYLLDGINGIQAYARLTEAIGRRVPAILLSGMSGDELAAETLECGMTFVRKPVNMDQLAAIIDAMLGETQKSA